MNTESQDKELHRLFVAKTDDSITPEDHARLHAMLADSAEARQQWFAFQDAEEGIAAWAQRDAASKNGAPAAALPKTEGSARRTSRGLRLRYVAALAAGIVIGALAWAAWPGGDEISPSGSNVVTRNEATTSAVAVLTRGAEMIWEDGGASPSLNEPLSPGLLKLKSGVAEVEFFQGARLCIEGPAEIRLVSAGEAFCTKGRFSAEVPPHAKGFRLGTPKGDLVDLGTEFGLDLNAATPELHVFKGEVELHQSNTPKHLFTTGQATGFTSEGLAASLAANASAFSFSHDLDQRLVSSQRAAFEKWQGKSARWNEDPTTRLHLDFQDVEGARSLRNVATHGDDITAGTIVGSTWTQGRWPGKRALQFRSLSDRVRLSVPGEHQQITLMASVQLHGLNIRQSSICMSQGLAAGYMHWQVLHDGALCLGVGVKEKPIVWEDYISPVVFTPERFGQWVNLAVVYDMKAGEVRFYVNGERLSRHPMKHPVALTPGLVELANWTPSPDKRQQPVRNFAGCMDEFMLFSRPLGDDEIRNFSR